ncbi:MAG: ABC transporter permease [Lachnospiraceae bacterium]|nr:ABC transporter permease [Lachnospiraceae bacterium]
MKFRMNPIVKKDLQVTARSMRLSWGLFAYEGVLTFAFMLALLGIQGESRSFYGGNIYSYLVMLFPVLAISQVCIVSLIVPLLTASSISGEKERQTFDIMMTTCMSPFSIVVGKVTSAVIRILFFVLAGTPIMALAFVVGGLSWLDLLSFMLVISLYSVFLGSIGIFCSSICKKAIAAVILSYVLTAVICGATTIPVILRMLIGRGKPGESLLFMLFNPILFFEEYFMQVMTGESLMADELSRSDVGILTYALSRGTLWIFISAACILLLSFVFMLLASWRVNPLHGSGTRASRKKK